MEGNSTVPMPKAFLRNGTLYRFGLSVFPPMNWWAMVGHPWRDGEVGGNSIVPMPKAFLRNGTFYRFGLFVFPPMNWWVMVGHPWRDGGVGGEFNRPYAEGIPSERDFLPFWSFRFPTNELVGFGRASLAGWRGGGKFNVATCPDGACAAEQDSPSRRDERK